jgi:predicted MFS family arabinose efflux permease
VVPDDRRTVAIAAYLHGLSHAVILSVPVLLTVAVTDLLGPGAANLGIFAGITYACFGVASLPFGFIADRRPARLMLLVCTASIVASLIAVAESSSAASLAIALAALGASAGIYHPTGLSLVSRTREPGRSFGWHGMGGSLGLAIGPAAATALLVGGWSWHTVALLFAAPAALGFALTFVSGIGRERAGAPSDSEGGSGIRLATAGMLLIFLVYVFAGISYWGSLTFLPRSVGPQSYVILLALGAVGQVVSGRIADRSRSDRILFALSLAAGALLLIVASISTNPPPAIAWPYGFLLFSLEPLQNTLVSREVPLRARGAAFGLTFFGVFGLGSAGAFLGGALLSGGAYGPYFAILGTSLVVSGLCALVAARSTRRRNR